MPIGNYTDNRSDWVDKTPFVTACSKLITLTENNLALIKQETFANWGGDSFNPFVGVTFTTIGYAGLTLFGDEPYDNVVFALRCACTEEGWPLLTLMDVWFRIYCVERGQYYPDATGVQMYSLPTWILGFPFPGWQWQTILIEVDITPPAGAWSAQSYEFQLQAKYSPSATQRLADFKGMIGVLERE
jgi:hypothetical protein